MVCKTWKFLSSGAAKLGHRARDLCRLKAVDVKFLLNINTGNKQEWIKFKTRTLGNIWKYKQYKKIWSDEGYSSMDMLYMGNSQISLRSQEMKMLNKLPLEGKQGQDGGTKQVKMNKRAGKE